MTTTRTPIERPRRPIFTDGILSLFVALERVPKHRRRQPEWRAKSKQLARLLGLTVE